MFLESEEVTVTLSDDVWHAVQIAISDRIAFYIKHGWPERATVLQGAQDAIDQAATNEDPAEIVSETLDCAD